MKKIFYTILFCSFIAGLTSCSNGDYQADPASNANGAVNPITPLTESQFTWGNNDVIMSADINGVHWEADYVTFALDTAGSNVMMGYKDGSDVRLHFYLNDVWGGNTYSMEWKDYKRYAVYIDSNSIYTDGAYYSHMSNSGGVKISANDTGVIKGLFYFKGISANNKVVNISNGVFNVVKP